MHYLYILSTAILALCVDGATGTAILRQKSGQKRLVAKGGPTLDRLRVKDYCGYRFGANLIW